MSKSKKITEKQVERNNIISPVSNTLHWIKYIPFVLGFLLYINTLGHDYTQDDAIVIYDNMFTQKGIEGISGLLSEDTFFGFFKERGKEKLVSGGRYRPFTPIMFAVEYQLFGKNPFIGHFINALLYGFLGFVIFQVLTLMFSFRNDYKESFVWVILSMVCLYLCHPVHTEAVANIKGRDEIMSMLGSMSALWFLIKNEVVKKMSNVVLAFFTFLIALLSKENAITFLAVVPLVFMLFFNKSFGKSLSIVFPLIGAAVLFLIMRTAVLGFDLGSTTMELMNNPFINQVGNKYVPFTFREKIATLFYIFLRYLGLLVFPHPLTHDYYPKQIPMMSFGDGSVLLSLFLFLGLLFAGFYFYKKDKVISFSILFFFITYSIVSNVFVNIGTNMNERFLFMPSLGFCILIPYLLYKLSNNKNLTLAVIALICLAFAYKTFSRNMVWKDDFTLFTTDVKTSTNSAKVLNAAGGALVTAIEKDKSKTQEYSKKAIEYLNKAIAIHPNYKNAHLLLGNAYFYANDMENSIKSYENSLRIDPDFKDAKNNLAVVYRDQGRYYGEKKNDLVQAEKYLKQSYTLNPNDAETNRLLGIAYGMAGQHQQSIAYFENVIKLSPKEAGGYLNLSMAYGYINDQVNAQKYREMALKIDPGLGKK